MMLRASCLVMLLVAVASAQEECSVPKYTSSLPSVDTLPVNGSMLIWTLTSNSAIIDVDNVTGDATLTLSGAATTTMFVTQTYGILDVTVGSLPTASFVEEFAEIFPQGINAQVQGEVELTAEPESVVAQSDEGSVSTVIAMLSDPQVEEVDGEDLITFSLTSAIEPQASPEGKGCADAEPLALSAASVAFNVYGYNLW